MPQSRKLAEMEPRYIKDSIEADKVSQPGATPALLKEKYPRYIVPSTMPDTGWWNRPYEKMEECYQRSGRVLETLLEKHGDTEDKVAVVSHGIFFNNLMFQLFGFSPENIRFYFGIQNVSITRVDMNAETKKLVYQNRVEFLPAHLIS